MMGWIDTVPEKLKTKVWSFLDEDESRGRYSLMEKFGLKEHQARQMVELFRKEEKPPIDILTVAVFDLETTDLKADVGGILVCSIYVWPRGEMITFRQDQIENKRNMADDSEMCRLVKEELDKHDIHIGWYSKGFDVTFLNTRLVKNGMKPIEPRLHVDPIWYFRGFRGLKPRSSKMSVVAEFYDLDDRKQAVDVQTWRDAAVGDTDAMDILVDRCESDVIITGQLAQKAFESGLVRNIQRYP